MRQLSELPRAVYSNLRPFLDCKSMCQKGSATTQYRTRPWNKIRDVCGQLIQTKSRYRPRHDRQPWNEMSGIRFQLRWLATVDPVESRPQRGISTHCRSSRWIAALSSANRIRAGRNEMNDGSLHKTRSIDRAEFFSTRPGVPFCGHVPQVHEKAAA